VSSLPNCCTLRKGRATPACCLLQLTPACAERWCCRQWLITVSNKTLPCNCPVSSARAAAASSPVQQARPHTLSTLLLLLKVVQPASCPQPVYLFVGCICCKHDGSLIIIPGLEVCLVLLEGTTTATHSRHTQQTPTGGGSVLHAYRVVAP